MLVNSILYSYSSQKYDQINQDYKKISSRYTDEKKQADKNQSIFDMTTQRNSKDLADYISKTTIKAEDIKQRGDIIEGIPVVGKLNSVPDKIEENDFIPASGIVSLALLNGPEDIREVVSAYKQIKAFVQGKDYEKPYDYKRAQHPFSFFRGTLLNDYVNPFSQKCKFPKLASWLLRMDKSLWDTKLGRNFAERFDVDIDEITTKEKSIYHTDEKPYFLRAYHFKSPSKFANLTARAMTRTPVIGLAFSGAMEAAHLIKEVKEGDNFFSELGKSATRLASSSIITGYLGAVGSKYGPTGSLIGMGLGAILNAKIERFTD